MVLLVIIIGIIGRRVGRDLFVDNVVVGHFDGAADSFHWCLIEVSVQRRAATTYGQPAFFSAHFSAIYYYITLHIRLLLLCNLISCTLLSSTSPNDSTLLLLLLLSTRAISLSFSRASQSLFFLTV